MASSIGRRTFLRGLGGTALALPLLDIMLDENGEALANGAAVAKRYLVTFGAFSLITDSEEGPDAFIPNALGPGYDIKTALAPVSAHGVADKVSVLSGLDVPKAAPSVMPPPGGINFFHRKSPAWFCGERVFLSTDKVPITATYPSSDQVVADAIDPSETAFHSLVYRGQVKHYYSGTEVWADDGMMSWRDDGTGTVVGIVPQASPKAAFDSLFTMFTPTDPTVAQQKALELAKRGSILDLIDRRGGGLMARLGAADRRRVEQHLTHVRDLEKLVSTVGGPSPTGSCQMLPDPGADPPIGGDDNSAFHGWTVDTGYSDEDTRIRVLTDLMVMAFTCDLTRVGSLMYTMIGSQLNMAPVTGIQRKLHSFHHTGGGTTAGTIAELNTMISWHVDHFARLVAKLRDTAEGAGTLLDSCAVSMLNEGGRGTGSGSHSSSDLAVLFAGGAGGLRQGEHVRVAARHPANALITLMNAAGAPASTLGEISGNVPEMLV